MKLTSLLLPAMLVGAVVLHAGSASAETPIEKRARAMQKPYIDYRYAQKERVAGAILVGSGILPMVVGIPAVQSLWRRDVEGGTGGGSFGLIAVAILVAGGICELSGIPLLIVGLVGPMHPPSPVALAIRPTAGPRGLTWSF